MRTTLAVAVAALAFTASASAAPPVPRLVYSKAVAYAMAQGKAHHVKVTCAAWSPVGLTAHYDCTFGSKARLDMDVGAPCHLSASLYGGPNLDLRIGEARYITLCRAGWQKDLPMPWTTTG